MEATRMIAWVGWLIADVVATAGAFRVLRGRHRLFLIGPVACAVISVCHWWLNRDALSGITRACANLWLWFGLSSCAWISSLLWLIRVVAFRRNAWRVHGLIAVGILAVAMVLDLRWGTGPAFEKGYAKLVFSEVLIGGGVALLTGLLAPPPDPFPD
jgi:hypothetical protein